MARFHNYSFGNIMLIARQKPQATNVAGIRTWNSLGRFVKRGEKGIQVRREPERYLELLGTDCACQGLVVQREDYPPFRDAACGGVFYSSA